MCRILAVSSIVSALPSHQPEASCTIISAPRFITTRSPAMATTEAAEAASASTVTVTRARWRRRAFMMVRPSQAAPPGEDRKTSSSSTSRASILRARSAGVVPESSQVGPIGP